MIGIALPRPGVLVATACPSIEKLAASGIFLISGVSIQPRQAAAVRQLWKICTASALAVLVATPVVGCTAVQTVAMLVCRHGLDEALRRAIADLAVGFCVLSCAPTTLSSCVTLAAVAGGPTAAAAALILTVLTNTMAVITMPMMLAWLAGGNAVSATINPIPLMAQLMWVVLLPTAVGAVIRARCTAVRQLVEANRNAISIVSSVLLCTVPWIQVSKATMSGALANIGASIIAAATAGGVVLHLLLLACSSVMVRAAMGITQRRLSSESTSADVKETSSEDTEAVRRAAILVGGQKTLPVSLTVLSQLGGTGGAIASFPIAMLPLLITHFSQIVMDSALVSSWRQIQ